MDEISNYVHIDHISFRKEGLTPHEAATEIGLNHHWPFEKCSDRDTRSKNRSIP